jgi:hypothetical protein
MGMKAGRILKKMRIDGPPIVKVTCTDTNQTVEADLIDQTDKRLRVSFKKGRATLTMTRSDTRKVYVGNEAGLEFFSKGLNLS